MSLELVQFENLRAQEWLVHGISTRHGGVSDGRFESLNTSYNVGDLEENVHTNLDRLADAVGTERVRLFAAYQVHGRAVTLVEPETEPRPRCDVLITRSTERTLMLRYADCTPVLIADPRQRVIAAVHAGWRGSAVRAAGAAVEALGEAFGSRPADLLAGIGPAIGPCCYVVGQDVVDEFSDRPWLFAENRLDLWESNRLALVEAGVPEEQIEVAAVCTMCHADRFFSHRANEGQLAGRFAAVLRLAC